jgi:hypothetical protein
MQTALFLYKKLHSFENSCDPPCGFFSESFVVKKNAPIGFEMQPRDLRGKPLKAR